MKHTERAFLFPCAGETLPGIVSLPDQGTPPEVGLLIVVGGPQYRVGSHRLFVKLARHAASQGLAAMRFDYRGMGDATGEMRTFEHIDDDLAAAMGAFRQQVPSLKRIVLWGLCDGASAACMYAARDPHVQGLILLNPWVHTTEGAAETKLRHYYLQRLFSAALWRKLLSGQMPKVRPFLVQVLTLVRGRLQNCCKHARLPRKQAMQTAPAPCPCLSAPATCWGAAMPLWPSCSAPTTRSHASSRNTPCPPPSGRPFSASNGWHWPPWSKPTTP